MFEHFEDKNERLDPKKTPEAQKLQKFADTKEGTEITDGNNKKLEALNANTSKEFRNSARQTRGEIKELTGLEMDVESIPGHKFGKKVDDVRNLV